MMSLLRLLLLLTASYIAAEPIRTPKHVFGNAINPDMFGHPGDYPFPTDMTFRNFANHSIDQTTDAFDPDKVQFGDTIYLADWYIAWFTRYVHTKIKYPYILISNDSDQFHPETGIWDYNEKNGWPPPVEAVRTLLYDSKVAFWFCKNMLLSRYPKIIQIPIGQNIIYWNDPQKKYLTDFAYLLELSKQKIEKPCLLYINMQLASHPSRPKIVELFQKQPYCLCRTTGLKRKEYFKEMSEAKFTTTPPGYGPDIVRFWEAILLDCIPIVKHNELDDLYAGMPMLFVHEWEEINEAFLHQKYQEIKQQNLPKDKAYFDFWANVITDIQRKVRQDNNPFSNIERTRFPKDTLDTMTYIFQCLTTPGDRVLCKGAAMALRPFELSQTLNFMSTFYVQDSWGAWGHEKVKAHLEAYVTHPLLYRTQNMRVISYYDNAYQHAGTSPYSKLHVIFDLTYRRHTLPKELEEAFQKSINKTLICGNCGCDSYVKEVLEKFARKNNVQVNFSKDVWFFVKM